MAFMANEVTVSTIPEYQSCDLLTSSKPYMPSTVGNALPKQSPFTGMFKYMLGLMIERGSFDKIVLKYARPPQSE